MVTFRSPASLNEEECVCNYLFTCLLTHQPQDNDTCMWVQTQPHTHTHTHMLMSNLKTRLCLFFFNFILFLNFTILYWFCQISKWIRHRYTCVPHPEPSSLPIPSLWVIPVHHPQASCILHQTWTGNSFLIWYYTCFNAILSHHPPPPPTESKRLFYTSVSLLLSCIQGCRHHLSKFHIYVLVYCIGVFLSGLLHSV